MEIEVHNYNDIIFEMEKVFYEKKIKENEEKEGGEKKKINSFWKRNTKRTKNYKKNMGNEIRVQWNDTCVKIYGLKREGGWIV